MKKNPNNIPSSVFVVELSKYILVTGFPIGQCIFPCYRFDNNINDAFKAADILGYEKNKMVVNAVDYFIHDPYVYDPRLLRAAEQRHTKEERELT
jgi:hypothetical protein